MLRRRYHALSVRKARLHLRRFKHDLERNRLHPCRRRQHPLVNVMDDPVPRRKTIDGRVHIPGQNLSRRPQRRPQQILRQRNQ